MPPVGAEDAVPTLLLREKKEVDADSLDGMSAAEPCRNAIGCDVELAGGFVTICSRGISSGAGMGRPRAAATSWCSTHASE
jgi:hypothetical protein